MKALRLDDTSVTEEVSAGLLNSLDEDLQLLEAIALASDLQTAPAPLHGHDAVLGDGMFPLRPHSGFIAEEPDVPCRKVWCRGIGFAVYTGSAQAFDRARECNAPTLAKSAAGEEINAALTNMPPPITVRGYYLSTGVAKD